MVNDTPCPALHEWCVRGGNASVPRETTSCRTLGIFFLLSQREEEGLKGAEEG